jgi:hypothetical protein
MERTWDEPPGRPHRWASRESFLASERAAVDREFSNLVEDEGDARERYIELASHYYGPDPGPTPVVPLAALSFRYEPEKPLSAAALAGATTSAVQSASNAWHTAYHALVERNPRLELSHCLKAVGRSLGTWWPFGIEAAIEQWVADGCVGDPPFKDSTGLTTTHFRDRLRWLRERVGGWIYFDPPSRRLLYAPQEEWYALRDRATADGAPIREMAIQTRASKERRQHEEQRVRDIEAEVRGDDALWTALLRWEREAGPVAPLRPPSGDVRAWMQWTAAASPRAPLTVESLRARFAEARQRDIALEAQQDAALPSSFHPFLDRFWRADVPLSRWRIYLLLRFMARRELGLDPPPRPRPGIKA